MIFIPLENGPIIGLKMKVFLSQPDNLHRGKGSFAVVKGPLLWMRVLHLVKTRVFILLVLPSPWRTSSLRQRMVISGEPETYFLHVSPSSLQ